MHKLSSGSSALYHSDIRVGLELKWTHILGNFSDLHIEQDQIFLLWEDIFQACMDAKRSCKRSIFYAVILIWTIQQGFTKLLCRFIFKYFYNLSFTTLQIVFEKLELSEIFS